MSALRESVAALELVARQLGALCDEMVFVGGNARGLLITDEAVEASRPTDDVDLVVEAASLGDYYGVSERLRQAGFRECDEPGAPLCRWKCGALSVDVMPTDPKPLGFSNRWYPFAFETAQRCTSRPCSSTSNGLR